MYALVNKIWVHMNKNIKTWKISQISFFTNRSILKMYFTHKRSIDNLKPNINILMTTTCRPPPVCGWGQGKHRGECNQEDLMDGAGNVGKLEIISQLVGWDEKINIPPTILFKMQIVFGYKGAYETFIVTTLTKPQRNLNSTSSYLNGSWAWHKNDFYPHHSGTCQFLFTVVPRIEYVI